MTKQDIFSKFSCEDHRITDGIVHSNGFPIGIFSPTTLFGTDADGRLCIHGRGGMSKIQDETKENFWKAVIDTDSILFGTPEEIDIAYGLLKNPALSRTSSYVSTLSGGCPALIRRMRSITSSNIIVVGCGGIGSLSAMNMAGAGVARITLVDHDKIEKSNLNRQFFWRLCDTGAFKVDILEKEIKSRWENIAIETCKEKIQTNELKEKIENYDAAIITADEPLGIGAQITSNSPTFVTYGGYFHDQLGYLAKTRSNHLSCEKEKDNQTKWYRSPCFIAPSSGPGNTEIAGLLSSACLHYLADLENKSIVDIKKNWRSSILDREDNNEK